MASLFTHPESFRFPLGTSNIQIWGGERIQGPRETSRGRGEVLPAAADAAAAQTEDGEETTTITTTTEPETDLLPGKGTTTSGLLAAMCRPLGLRSLKEKEARKGKAGFEPLGSPYSILN